MTPFVGWVEEDVGDLSGLCFNPEEVDDVFCLSLRQLLDPGLVGREDLGARGPNAPFFMGGKGKVYGLSAFITEGVLESVLKPCL